MIDGEVQISVEDIDDNGVKRTKDLIKRCKSEHFGEFAMVSHVPRTANVTALKPTKILALERRKYEEINRNYDDALAKRFRPRTWGAADALQIPGHARRKTSQRVH